MADSGRESALVVVAGTSQPLVVAAAAAAAAASATTAPVADDVARGERFRNAAHVAAREAVIPPLPTDSSKAQKLSSSARAALVVSQLLEPADHVHGFVLADNVAGASDSTNSSSLVSVVRKLMPGSKLAEKDKSALWMRAFGGCPLLAQGRDVHWAGTLRYDERVTPERSESRVIKFLARDANERMPRPYLGVQYRPSAQLVPLLAELHALNLITISPRAALTLVETARDTVVPRPPPELLRPPLAHASGGLASIALAAVQTFEALPGNAIHPFLRDVKGRLETDAGREHFALVRATAGWLRAGAGPDPTDERVCRWARGIFVQEAAVGLMENSRVNLDEPRSTGPCPYPPTAASPLTPSPFSEAGASRATQAAARATKRPRAISAEEVTDMSAVDLAALGGELLQMLQLVSQEGIKRAALAAVAPGSAARSPLRPSNAR